MTADAAKGGRTTMAVASRSPGEDPDLRMNFGIYPAISACSTCTMYPPGASGNNGSGGARGVEHPGSGQDRRLQRNLAVRQRERDRFGARLRTELLAGRLCIRAHRLRRQPEALGDRRSVVTVREQAEDLALAV